jgi:carbon-monoxide dehydrogenase medium subunit
VLRLPRFELLHPASLGEAVSVLAAAGGGARLLAGGTDLVVDMKLGKARPAVVVDLKRIPGLGGIERVSGGSRLGALVTAEAIAGSATLRGSHRALWQAAGVLGSPPVRHMATIGGNLGRGSPASELTPPLVAYGARTCVTGPGGDREVPVEDLPAGPGQTCLGPGEVITGVLVPGPAPRSGSAHRKLGKRAGGWDLAIAGVSAALTLDEAGAVAEARIALASVGPTVLRARRAEGLLLGRVPSDAVLAEAARAASADARPIDDLRASAGYRRAVLPVLVRRALEEALLQAQEAPA